MKTILLKFSGPLQSWGSSSHFQTRRTDLCPSKSAVIGMIAAACGYRRDDDEYIRRLNQLHFAVRIDQPGEIAKDYQTAQRHREGKKRPDPKDTYITPRYYLEDALFLVAVGHEDDDWIDRIAEALQHPYFPLYMGRRSYPVPADFFMGCINTDVITALHQQPWQASSWYQRKHRKTKSVSLSLHADACLIPERKGNYRRDYVDSFSWEGRRYLLRQESKTLINIDNPSYKDEETEHDAFAWVEE